MAKQKKLSKETFEKEILALLKKYDAKQRSIYMDSFGKTKRLEFTMGPRSAPLYRIEVFDYIKETDPLKFSVWKQEQDAKRREIRDREMDELRQKTIIETRDRLTGDVKKNTSELKASVVKKNDVASVVGAYAKTIPQFEGFAIEVVGNAVKLTSDDGRTYELKVSIPRKK